MAFFSLSAGFRRLGWLLGAALVLPLAATAQATSSPAGFFDKVESRTVFAVGWQVGQYAQHGMGNMYYHALRLNRDPNTAALAKPMKWSPTFGGVAVGLTYMDDHLFYEFRWNNRHTIHSAEWTDQAGQDWNTSYRVRLNELSFGAGYPMWGGRLRVGASGDLGIFRVSRRDGKGSDKGKWGSMHSRGEGLLAPGEKTPTAGFTLFADVAPLGFSRPGGGLTLRVFRQWHIIEADLFGLAGTYDTRSFVYGIQNYGLALSWGFASK